MDTTNILFLIGGALFAVSIGFGLLNTVWQPFTTTRFAISILALACLGATLFYARQITLIYSPTMPGVSQQQLCNIDASGGQVCGTQQKVEVRGYPFFVTQKPIGGFANQASETQFYGIAHTNLTRRFLGPLIGDYLCFFLPIALFGYLFSLTMRRDSY